MSARQGQRGEVGYITVIDAERGEEVARLPLTALALHRVRRELALYSHGDDADRMPPWFQRWLLGWLTDMAADKTPDGLARDVWGPWTADEERAVLKEWNRRLQQREYVEPEEGGGA